MHGPAPGALLQASSPSVLACSPPSACSRLVLSLTFSSFRSYHPRAQKGTVEPPGGALPQMRAQDTAVLLIWEPRDWGQKRLTDPWLVPSGLQDNPARWSLWAHSSGEETGQRGGCHWPWLLGVGGLGLQGFSKPTNLLGGFGKVLWPLWASVSHLYSGRGKASLLGLSMGLQDRAWGPAPAGWSPAPGSRDPPHPAQAPKGCCLHQQVTLYPWVGVHRANSVQHQPARDKPS